jgi:hypothetical protein
MLYNRTTTLEKEKPMATFEVSISFHFDTTYEVEADSYEEAEEKAMGGAEEWLPYSSVKGYTDNWYSVEIENCSTNDELDEEDE